MALGGLKKGDRKIKAIASEVADLDRVRTVDDFIYAAPLQARGDALTAEVIHMINDLRMMAIDLQASGSDVIKAAITYLARQGKDTVIAELQAIAKPNK